VLTNHSPGSRQLVLSRTPNAVRTAGLSLAVALTLALTLDPATALAADCAEIEATVPKYRQCVVEAEAAVRQLRGSSSQVLPGSAGGGSTGAEMSDQYQQMAATCRAAESRARQLLQDCRAGSGTPTATGPSSRTPGRDAHDPSVADAVDEALRQARQLAELMRSRFDGAQTVEQLEELAREIRQLRVAAASTQGRGVA
jgi:hypothetical protein